MTVVGVVGVVNAAIPTPSARTIAAAGEPDDVSSAVGGSRFGTNVPGFGAAGGGGGGGGFFDRTSGVFAGSFVGGAVGGLPYATMLDLTVPVFLFPTVAAVPRTTAPAASAAAAASASAAVANAVAAGAVAVTVAVADADADADADAAGATTWVGVLAAMPVTTAVAPRAATAVAA